MYVTSWYAYSDDRWCVVFKERAWSACHRVVLVTCVVYRRFITRSCSTRSSWWSSLTSCVLAVSTCHSTSSESFIAVECSSSSGWRHSPRRCAPSSPQHLKPRPHQRQCRTKFRPFDNVATNWTRLICCDFVERTKFRSTLSPKTATLCF